MAKKSRRVRRRRSRPSLSEAQLVQPAAQDAISAAEAPAVAPALRPKVEPTRQPAALDFRQEYQYVVSDLQRIGVLAAVILGALVTLSLVL